MYKIARTAAYVRFHSKKYYVNYAKLRSNHRDTLKNTRQAVIFLSSRAYLHIRVCRKNYFSRFIKIVHASILPHRKKIIRRRSYREAIFHPPIINFYHLHRDRIALVATSSTKINEIISFFFF